MSMAGFTDRPDNAEATARRYGYIRGTQQAANPNSEPSIDSLVRDYMGAAVPAEE